MDEKFAKFEIKLESDEGLDEILSYLVKNDFKVKEVDKTKLKSRLRLIARRFGFKTFSDLLILFKRDNETLIKTIKDLNREFKSEDEKKEALRTQQTKKDFKLKEKKERKTRLKIILPKELSVFSEPTDIENIPVLLETLEKTGVNYNVYKTNYFFRRLHGRMRRVGATTYRDYSILLGIENNERNLLISNLSINVTRFFRDRDLWEALKSNILPSLFNSKIKLLKIWSAGCAVGAEPYSLAIIIDGLLKRPSICKVEIYGTDIKNEFLVKAREGIYQEDLLTELDPLQKAIYFTMIGEGKFKVAQDIQRAVTFQVHDLKQPPPFNNLNLILCRNVLIYFSKSQSKQLFVRFYEALSPGGYLVLGKCELLPMNVRDKFAVINSRERIYQKKEV